MLKSPAKVSAVVVMPPELEDRIPGLFISWEAVVPVWVRQLHPALPGKARLWGRGLLCPHCSGIGRDCVKRLELSKAREGGCLS